MRLMKALFISCWFAIVSFCLSFCSCEGDAPTLPAEVNDSASSHAADGTDDAKPKPDANDPNWFHPRSAERIQDREHMVEVLRRRYGMTDQQVLEAMLNVPRHWFVPQAQQSAAYVDSPLPIGHGQTISQPFIVAFMTHLLELTAESRVLEIGTGSGYQAAILSELTPHVFTIEIVEPLGKQAIAVFKERGYQTIRAKIGDGYKGWPEYVPFDAVIVTCAPDHIPQPLVDQLKPGGKIVIPVGETWSIQELYLVTKNRDGSLKKQSMMPVRFVPLVREKK